MSQYRFGMGESQERKMTMRASYTRIITAPERQVGIIEMCTTIIDGGATGTYFVQEIIGLYNYKRQVTLDLMAFLLMKMESFLETCEY